MSMIQVHGDPLGSVFKLASFHRSQLTGLIMNQLTLDVVPGSSTEKQTPHKVSTQKRTVHTFQYACSLKN